MNAQELAAAGWQQYEQKPCPRCEQRVVPWISPSGREVLLDLDGRMHHFRCGEAEPQITLPPVTDQEARLREAGYVKVGEYEPKPADPEKD